MSLSRLQVIEQRRNHPREDEKQGRQQGHQGPIEPGHANGPLVEPAKHRRPQIPLQLAILHRRQGPFQGLTGFFVVSFAHGSTPNRCSFLRSRRTARKTRDFTAPTEIPSASAICSYGSSSMSARVAATWYFA